MPGRNKSPLLGWHPPAELSARVRAEANRLNLTITDILNWTLTIGLPTIEAQPPPETDQP